MARPRARIPSTRSCSSRRWAARPSNGSRKRPSCPAMVSSSAGFVSAASCFPFSRRIGRLPSLTIGGLGGQICPGVTRPGGARAGGLWVPVSELADELTRSRTRTLYAISTWVDRKAGLPRDPGRGADPRWPNSCSVKSGAVCLTRGLGLERVNYLALEPRGVDLAGKAARVSARRGRQASCPSPRRSPASMRTGSRFSAGVSGHENRMSYTHDGW